MSKLKKSMIRGFLLFSFLLTVVLSITDSLFDGVTAHVGDAKRLLAILAFFFLLEISIYGLFAVFFTRFADRKIALENQRIAKQTNLLFANIAHDLKTPLTTVIGFSRALRDDVVQDEETAKKMLVSVVQKAERANELLDIMFEYTKVNSGALKLTLECCDMSRLMREVTAEHYDLFEEKGIEIDIDICETPVMAEIDQAEMKRAVSNLIVNAYKHNARGGKVLIQLDDKTDHEMRIIVADDGIAIANEKREELFNPFVSGDQSRSSDGTGLGLAITKAIVERHGYTIGIKDMRKPYTKAFVISGKKRAV